MLDTRAPVHYQIFDDMKHMGYTDAKFYIPGKMLTGKMEPQYMYDHLSEVHVKFFDKYLKGHDLVLEERMEVR